VPELEDEIATYERMRAELEVRQMGKWVVIHDRVVVGFYDSFEGAAEDAVRKFGRGPYLIRRIGPPP